MSDRYAIPALADCAPEIEPVEYQVLIALAEPVKVSAGGIILTDQRVSHDAWGATSARVIALSQHAFTYVDTWAPNTKPQVGDVVFCGQYPGDKVTGRDGKEYRLVQDREIKAVMERGERAAAAPAQSVTNERVRSQEEYDEEQQRFQAEAAERFEQYRKEVLNA